MIHLLLLDIYVYINIVNINFHFIIITLHIDPLLLTNYHMILEIFINHNVRSSKLTKIDFIIITKEGAGLSKSLKNLEI